MKELTDKLINRFRSTDFNKRELYDSVSIDLKSVNFLVLKSIDKDLVKGEEIIRLRRTILEGLQFCNKRRERRNEI